MAEETRKNTAYNDNDLTALRAALVDESSKPFKKQDIKKLSELSAAIAELEKNENAEPLQRCDEAIYREIEKRKNKTFIVRRLKPVIAVCCVIGVLLTANVISVSAWHMNIFSLIVELTEGGAVIDFGNQNEEIVLPTSEDDPYGIIARCEENGITADTPHYLPDGFVLSRTEDNSSEVARLTQFMYRNGKQEINITCRQYLNDVPKMGIASDEHNLTEVTINGTQAIISKEDNQMNFLYNRGNYVLNIFTQDVDYDECEKIIQSIK